MLRLTAIALALVLAGATIAPAAAQPAQPKSAPVIAHVSAKKGARGVYLAHGLVPGHAYRVEITAPKKTSIAGQAFMNYTYFANKHLATGTKSFTIRGNTPYSYTVKQPISAHLSGWLLVVSAQETGSATLTVAYRDLGKA